MAMVDVDSSSHLSADSQPNSVGLVCGLAATRRSVCIHQMNRVNSRSDHGHEDSTINVTLSLIIIIIIIIIIILLLLLHCREQLQEAQYQASKANLVACRHCSRRFAPDRVSVHERVCKGVKTRPPPDGASLQREDARRDNDSPVAFEVRRQSVLISGCQSIIHRLNTVS